MAAGSSWPSRSSPSASEAPSAYTSARTVRASPSKQLGGRVLGRHAHGQHPGLAPGGGETKVDQRRFTVCADDDVGWLDVAVKEPGPVQRGELGARLGQRVRPGRPPSGVHQLREALTDDQLPDEEPTHATDERTERDDARHPQPLEARQRHRLAHERQHLRLTGPLGEHLQGEPRAADSISDLPHLAGAARTEAPLGFIAWGEGGEFHLASLRRSTRVLSGSAHFVGFSRP